LENGVVAEKNRFASIEFSILESTACHMAARDYARTVTGYLLPLSGPVRESTVVSEMHGMFFALTAGRSHFSIR
jgi:hypothetical protein